MVGDHDKAKKMRGFPGKEMGSGQGQRVLNKLPVERNGKPKKLSTTKKFARWRQVFIWRRRKCFVVGRLRTFTRKKLLEWRKESPRRIRRILQPRSYNRSKRRL